MNEKGKCLKCNNENEYSKVICDFCGSRLPWAAAVQSAPAQAPVAQPAHPQAKHQVVIFWVLGCLGAMIIIPAILTFLALVFLGGKSASTPTPPQNTTVAR